jgi:FKBP-type peptidyl-prolyl cis-trans isomerase
MITTPSGLKYENDKDIGGSPIKLGQLVRLNYKVALSQEDLIYSKNLIDTSDNREEPVVVKVGAGDMLPGIEEGIIGMGKGDTRLLVIPPELAFGKRGIPGIIPEDATVYVEINISTKAA